MQWLVTSTKALIDNPSKFSHWDANGVRNFPTSEGLNVSFQAEMIDFYYKAEKLLLLFTLNVVFSALFNEAFVNSQSFTFTVENYNIHSLFLVGNNMLRKSTGCLSRLAQKLAENGTNVLRILHTLYEISNFLLRLMRPFFIQLEFYDWTLDSE